MAQEGGAAVEHGQAPHGAGGAREVAPQRLVAIGEIVRPHGLGGEVRIRTLTDQPARFDALTGCIVWDPDGDGRVERRIERAQRRGGTVILKLRGIDEVDAARALVGRLVAVPESEAAALAPGHFYPWQLEGCRVETDRGVPVGNVTGIEQGPAQDLWVVSDGARERLIPAVPEIVITVDLRARRVVIRPPEGLLDL
ncbi:MAG: 16S rRNA processing protein RimM [Candidatus Rokuibacteriota bacterium]|nr:MAG: 16S rRNA processing protein RimM [Candidatus Rokubacteria bacterium]